MRAIRGPHCGASAPPQGGIVCVEVCDASTPTGKNDGIAERTFCIRAGEERLSEEVQLGRVG
jgi:hypothetical protein